ncbi:hypothetical protein CM1200mP19_1920 [bacterium]|nr:MAG: hypothetical protein CM1200mP19_1920 [bacterium]
MSFAGCSEIVWPSAAAETRSTSSTSAYSRAATSISSTSSSSWAGSWWKKHQFANRGLVGDLQRVVDRAVAPVRTLGELLGGELGIVDQEVHAIGQGQYPLVDPGRIVVRLLMVAHVGHAAAVPFDPIAEVRPCGAPTGQLPAPVRHRNCPRWSRAGTPGPPTPGSNGKEGRSHKRVEGLLQWPPSSLAHGRLVGYRHGSGG